MVTYEFPYFSPLPSSAQEPTLLAHTNTSVHTSVQKACCSLHVEGEGLIASAQTSLLCIFVFPDLLFEFGQLHRCIKLPINSHKNQEIITLRQSISLQPCAEITQHADRISNDIRRGCPNHGHDGRYPSRASGCHPTLGPAER